jgi:hypothetical protein
MKSKMGKHITVDRDLKRSLFWLQIQPEASKVILGLTESARHAFPPGALRYQRDELGGIKLNAYGGNGIVSVFVKVSDGQKQSLIAKIKQRWDI